MSSAQPTRWGSRAKRRRVTTSTPQTPGATLSMKIPTRSPWSAVTAISSSLPVPVRSAAWVAAMKRSKSSAQSRRKPLASTASRAACHSASTGAS